MNSSSSIMQPRLTPHMTFTVIGLGGVGSWLAKYLALLLGNQATPTRLVLCDGDEYEPDNAARQWFKRPGPKAEIVKEELLEVVRHTNLTVVSLNYYLTPESIARIIPGKGRQVVALAVDNHRTRALASRHIEGWDMDDEAEIALFSGGNDPAEPERGKIGSYGNVQVFIKRKSHASLPLTTYHPEIADPQDVLPDQASCTEQLDRRPQILSSNIHVAAWLYSSIYLYLCGVEYLPFSELYVDWADGAAKPAGFPAPAALLQGREAIPRRK